MRQVSGWYFNGPATVRRKAQWAKQHGLAGVMVWEVGQDSPVCACVLRVCSVWMGLGAAPVNGTDQWKVVVL